MKGGLDGGGRHHHLTYTVQYHTVAGSLVQEQELAPSCHYIL